MVERPYTYYDFTLSLCSQCLQRIDAKILFEEGRVYMHKRCPQHGAERVLLATDVEYYKRCRHYLKPGEMVRTFNTATHYGCPYDCGICPDHEQHGCLTLVEVTDRCNLECPVCYTSSGPHQGRHYTLEEIEKMLDAVVRNEGEPDVVQLSGGEPTIHPQFFEILDAARRRPIRHLMVNTNGVRIARERAFAERLATYMPDFEVYLQFDSFKPDALSRMRGEDLVAVRMKALEHLNELNLSTTLVVTVQKGVNDDELGAVIDFALKQRCVRGVTFQPVQVAGRVENYNSATDRMTLTEVRQSILDQSPVFRAEDIVPVPCNPDALAMAYALKWNDQAVPLTRMIDPDVLLNNSRNTIVYEQDAELRQHMLKLFSTGTPSDKAHETLRRILCCLPDISAPQLNYQNLFRIIIMRFMDAHDFDVRAIKRSCVHIIDRDTLHAIPFETMNLFYRTPAQRARLQILQNSQVPPQQDTVSRHP